MARLPKRHEPRVLDAVEVGQRRLELGHPVEDREEVGSFIFGWL